MHELHQQMRQRYEEWERRAIKRGRQQALSDVLVGLLTQRFGSVPDSALARIHEADADSLALWASRVLTAASLEDVLA